MAPVSSCTLWNQSFPFDVFALFPKNPTMKSLFPVLLLISALDVYTLRAEVHVWEKVELTFHAQNQYANPYTNVEVWVDLKGPGFDKRCYGFWDGDNVFRVRVLATQPGQWSWQSGSNQKDAGLNNHQGSFKAVTWSEAEKESAPARRGFIRPSGNGHALDYADGTPFLLLGDTWYAAGTYRFPWHDDDRERSIGPDAGFKDFVHLRKSQGFNSVAIIAAFPNWAQDSASWDVWYDKSSNIAIRSTWVNQGDIANHVPRDQWHAKDMTNEGGRAFLFPGKVPGFEQVYPDVDRINPEYFKYLDRKIDYLNAQGFIPVIEVARRDVTSAWAKFYQWPESYSRYIQYVWNRYQANNCVFSPVHFDWPEMTATPKQLNQAANYVIEKYGSPPFGTLVSCNASVSSLLDFGGTNENQWLTLHQIGNLREHDAYWYLTEIFNSTPTRPALNGEPYYSGIIDKRYPPYKYGAPGNTPEDDRDVRSGIYGSFLSGGLAGHIYGAEAIWGADIEPGSNPTMWAAFQWSSANMIKYLKTFAMGEGSRYQDLVPDANLVSPSGTHLTKGFTGWAYCARTSDQTFFLAYFEKDCPNRSMIRGALPKATYQAKWFDPRTGQWSKAGNGTLTANVWGWVTLPDFPSNDDWGLKLTAVSGERN
jgi:hypothetical protein